MVRMTRSRQRVPKTRPATNAMRRRPLVGIAFLMFGALAIVASALVSQQAEASTSTLFVDPASQQVSPSQSFAVTVRHNADVPIAGLQFNLSYDPALVQIVSITRGDTWLNAGASFLLGVAPQMKQQAIDEANTTGLLKSAALFVAPGGSTIPPGPDTAFTIAMQAKLGVDGVSPLTLTNLGVLDTSGGSVPVTGTGGSVTVGNPQPTDTPNPTETPLSTDTPDPNAGPSSTPTASTTPTVTSTASATSTRTATPTGTQSPTLTATAQATNTPTMTSTPTPSPEPTRSATMKLVPSSQTVPPSFAFPVHVSHTANYVVSGAESDVVFDPALLQVVSLVKSPAYNGAQLLAGTTDLNVTPPKRQTLAEAIAEANTTGRLKNMAVFYTPGQGSAAAGENAFITINWQAKTTDGESQIKLGNTEMVDEAGASLGVSPTSGSVKVQTGAVPPTPVPPPVAQGSGATTPVAGTSGSTNTVAGASARPGSARGLPSTGDGGFSRDRMSVLMLGLISVALGAALVVSGRRARR